VTAAVAFTRRGAETKLVLPGLAQQNHSSRCDPALIKAIARGRAWFEELATGRARSLQQLAKRDGISRRYIRRLVGLAFLSPQLVEAILQGRQPVELTATRLTELDLPLDWTEQHNCSQAKPQLRTYVPQVAAPPRPRVVLRSSQNLQEVGLHQCRSERKATESRCEPLHVPSQVPSHPQNAAKLRGSLRKALGFTAETDCLLEEGGFELAVPPRTERPWETQPGYYRDVEPETRTSRSAMPSRAFRSSGTEGSNPLSSSGESSKLSVPA
jgi:hypothetical protein